MQNLPKPAARIEAPFPIPTRHTILSLIHFGYPPVPIDPVSFAPVEKSDLGLDDSYCFGIIKIYVGSINGLICVTGLYEGSIAIWNPSTRVFRQVPPGRIKIYETSIGFGWDPIANDYKELGGEIKADRNFFIQRHICDVIVNGFTHWIVKDGLGSDSKPLIASFDMTTEVLRLVPVPEHLPWLVPLPPLVPERQLLLGQHYPLFGMNWKGTFALVGCVSRDPVKIYQVWTMENDTCQEGNLGVRNSPLNWILNFIVSSAL
ncbi:F-box domain-containing protein [Abeliophyllum distichum]|uniref:F-box domain-containing protein n=1 Tax=Abeliophyllum distichum TaxID=126358 RepID=A0ABD1QH81_9LAMI